MFTECPTKTWEVLSSDDGGFLATGFDDKLSATIAFAASSDGRDVDQIMRGGSREVWGGLVDRLFVKNVADPSNG